MRCGAIIFASTALAFTAAAQTEGDYPHPTISADGSWIGVVWLIIGGLFLAAAVIGPIVRANLPEDEVMPSSQKSAGD
jgi:hypothetical protein